MRALPDYAKSLMQPAIQRSPVQFNIGAIARRGSMDLLLVSTEMPISAEYSTCVVCAVIVRNVASSMVAGET